MNTAVTIFGWLCLVFVCAAIAGFAVALAADLVRRAMERFEYAIAEKTRAEIGRSLLSTRHWFSESKDVEVAIQVLAGRLRDQYGIDADQWRAEWRRLRNQTEGKPA